MSSAQRETSVNTIYKSPMRPTINKSMLTSGRDEPKNSIQNMAQRKGQSYI